MTNEIMMVKAMMGWMIPASIIKVSLPVSPISNVMVPETIAMKDAAAPRIRR